MNEIIGGAVGLIGLTLYTFSFSSQNGISILELWKTEETRKLTLLWILYFLYLIAIGIFFLKAEFDQESLVSFILELVIDILPVLFITILMKRYKR